MPAAIEPLQQRDANVAVSTRAVPVHVVDDRPVPKAQRERLRRVGPRLRPISPRHPRTNGGPQDPCRNRLQPPSPLHLPGSIAIEYDRLFLRDRVEQFRSRVNGRLSGEHSEDEFKPFRLMKGFVFSFTATCCMYRFPTSGGCQPDRHHTP